MWKKEEELAWYQEAELCRVPREHSSPLEPTAYEVNAQGKPSNQQDQTTPPRDKLVQGPEPPPNPISRHHQAPGPEQVTSSPEMSSH